MKTRPLLLALLLALGLTGSLLAARNLTPPVHAASFAQQVVELVNLERTRANLPPLKANRELEAAAAAQSQAMATQDFFSHDNPHNGANAETRIEQAGYFPWRAIAENIAVGQDSADKVVADWMSSPGHRENILNPEFSETGVGYILDSADTFPDAGAPYRHYWTQTFGRRDNVFPLVINGEQAVTNSPQVKLYLYGKEWAQEMRLRNDDDAFGEWQPFQANIDWMLPATDGAHTVYAELRNGTNVLASSDTIQLDSSASGSSSVPATTAAPTSIATTAPTSASVASPVPNSIGVTAQVNPTPLRPGDVANVSIQIDAQTASAQCLGIPGAPVDAILIIDNSASAGKGAASKLEHAKALANSVIDQASPAVLTDPDALPLNSRVGLITANIGVTGTIVSLFPLSEDYAQVKTEIAAIESGADTGFEDGLKLAQDELNRKAEPGRHKAIILFLHDNGGFNPNAFDAASKLASDIAVYVVGLGQEPDIDSASIQQMTRRALAESYLFDPKPAEMRQFVVKMSGGRTDLAGRGATISAGLEPSKSISLDPSSISDDGQIVGGQVVWKIDELEPGEKFTRSFKAKIASGAATNVESSGAAVFLDCNGFRQEISFGQPITLGPTYTPTPLGPIATPVAPVTTGPAVTSIPGATVALPQLTPTLLTLSVCPATPSPIQNLMVSIPPSPGKADVVFVFDVSGSMNSVLQSAAANATTIMSDLAALLGDVQFGVVGFSDYPVLPYGAPSDHPYILHQALTGDRSKVQNALNGLTLENGEDTPEAYSRALYEMYSDPAVGWRTGSRRFVIMFGDSVPHDSDPGRDGSLNTADDLEFDAVLDELRDEQMTLLFVSSTNETAIQDNWKQWVSKTYAGGNSVTLADAKDLPNTVKGLIAGATRHIGNLQLVTDPPSYQSWIQVTPPNLSSLDIPDTGLTENFQVVVAPPSGATAGANRFQVQAIADGAVLAIWNVDLTISGTCAPAPAPTPVINNPNGQITAACPDWSWWLLPLLLLPLAFLLWWLANRWRGGPDWWKNKRAVGPKCWVPCLLALLALMGLFYLIGHQLVFWACQSLAARPAAPVGLTYGTPQALPTVILTGTPPSAPSSGGVIGSNGSERVAAMILGSVFDLSSRRPGVTFDRLDPSKIDPAALNQYDTLVISQFCSIGSLPASDQQTLKDWVASGRKLIIYDSDECSAPVDYSWLPYPFTTNNPGALGSTSGEFRYLSDDTLVSPNPSSPGYVDPANMKGIEIGDANVMVTKDLRWCANAEALNANGQTGVVHAYALYGKGIIIYNGLDTDNIGSPGMNAMWQHELDQSWDSVNGQAPSALTCQIRVALIPTPIPGGASASSSIPAVPLVLPLWTILCCLIPLIPLMILCWLWCQRRPVGEGYPPVKPVKPTALPPTFTDMYAGRPPVWRPGPALIIGLGGTGRWVLTHLKKNLLDAGAGKWQPQVRLLAIDTNPEEIVAGKPVSVQFAGAQLDVDQVLTLSEDLREALRQLVSDPNADSELAQWFPVQDYRQRLTEAEMNVKQHGSGQRRPIGRAMAFRDVQKSPSDSLLWRRLVQPLREIYQESQTQIFIVGSLAGGTGSGELFDLAYLLRLASRAVTKEGIPLAAFLVTDNAFAVQTRDQKLKLNAMGALRELGRFLLAKGIPYPMVYRQRSTDAILNGYVTESLFDDCYLFDGERAHNALTRWTPQIGMFPMMADVITVLLDRLDPEGRNRVNDLVSYRSNTRATTSAEQLHRGEPVVSSYGAYTYRLPLLDIVNTLRVRFARDLVHWFLTGSEQTQGPIALNPNQNQEAAASKPADVAADFMLRAGDAARVIWRVDQKGMSEAVRPELESLGAHNVEKDKAAFQTMLNQELLRLLNGQAQQDIVIARTGKLGFTQAFLQELEALLARVEQQFGQLQWPGAAGQGAHTMAELAAAFKTIASQAQTNLVQVTAALYAEQSGGAKPGETTRGASVVYQGLQKELDAQTARRQEMAQIIVRKYFMDDALLERLYTQYWAPQLRPNLERLYWRAKPDGALELTLSYAGQTLPLALEREKQQAFVETLLTLGEIAGQDVWRERFDVFLDDPDTGDWRDTVMTARAQELRGWTDPPLDFRVGHTTAMQLERFMWANQTIQQTTPFIQAYTRGAVGSSRVQTLEASDPYSATLLTSVDVVPLSVLECYKRLEAEYKLANGLSSSPAVNPEIVQVFTAEQNALQFERRLGELNEPPRLFHPQFVAALDNLDRAHQFALAFALGWVRRQYDPAGSRYQLRLPQSGLQVWLTRREAPGEQIPLYIIAMQGFVLGNPERESEEHGYSSEELGAKLAAELQQLGKKQIKTLQNYVKAGPEELRDDTRIGARDFVSFTRLAVWDYLRWRYSQTQQ